MAATPSNVRRSGRASLPDTHLLYRRQMIRENFCITTGRSIQKRPSDRLSTIKPNRPAKVQKSKNKNKKKKKPPPAQQPKRTNRQTKHSNANRNMNGNGIQDSGSDDGDSDDQTSPEPIFDEFISAKTEKLSDTNETPDVPKSFGKLCDLLLSI